MDKNVMKKICFYILIFSFLNYIGCYSWRSIDKEILYSQDLGEPAGIVVITMNDEKKIEVREGIYDVMGDTLYVKGVKQNSDHVEQFVVKIALDDIQSIEIEEHDTLANIGLVIVIAAIAYSILAAIYIMSLTN